MEKVITNRAEENLRIVRQAFEASNTGDTSRVHEFIVRTISIMNHK